MTIGFFWNQWTDSFIPTLLSKVDTNSLTEYARKILWLANEFSEELCTELGASAKLYDKEEQFLQGALGFIDEILDDSEDYLDFWNILETTVLKEFQTKVQSLREQIVTVSDIPIESRGPLGWSEEETMELK